ncbi:MAG TPA: hypothetical protein VJ570_06400 [Holophagaceae bacterium]|nr:hypothetical protein [Holophagaceae bacterium]
MRRSSQLFLLLLAGAFLAALAWALVAQSNLWRAHARPRPPGSLPEAAADPAPPGTGVIGTVDEGTAKALEKSLKAEQEARKRLDAPPPKRK